MKVVARGPKRAFALAAVLSLTALLLVASGSAAPAPESADTEGLVGPVWTPVGLRGGETTVVLQLSGDPVALVQAEKGRKLSKSEKQAVRIQLKAAQDGLRGGIAKLGGTVLAEYQFAYNGIKVRVDRSKLADLAALPGVTAVRALQVMKPDNVRGVPLIGAPAVWDGLAGLHGEGIKVAVIDTGIDYTHANFGGPGTEAAYNAAERGRHAAAERRPSVGALRVKGGIDFVGDDYDADRGLGHVSAWSRSPTRTRSTATGTALTSPVRPAARACLRTVPPTTARTTRTRSARTPGRSARASRRRSTSTRLRVFGCLGSTDVTVDAIEWAVENDMDVINMSLGSSFGSKNDPSAVASTNAAKAGVDRRHVRRATTARASTSPARRAPRAGAISDRCGRSDADVPGCDHHRRDADDPGDQRERASESHRQRHAEGDQGRPGHAGQRGRGLLGRRVRRTAAGRTRSRSSTVAPAPAWRRRSSASRPAQSQ